ncbi:alpha/beta fold hydrolase [Oleomonas cavernae]|uniref:Alpha/beta fold hydrolase n=1 Tax=Oleomonas cavernae TaxID=2320859 RepID=A0A418WEZ2_9PROT|nr:alpha/beta fold hydrolase [Oleomonas cavernae]RJF88601.1 alpha/beta fold hydrolase [Oleomonas cavernae]
MRPVETRYARSGETRIAYQVIGQGSLDLVLVPGFLSNLDILWEDPGYARLVRRLSRFSRLILFDKRGTGLSDPVPMAALPDLSARSDDIRAVMDATGSTRAALLGASEGAAMAIVFAATWPARVRNLVLYGGYARFDGSVMDARRRRAFLDSIETSWGGSATLAHFAPGRADDRRFAEWWARFERLSASPTCALALARMNGAIDLGGLPSGVKAPTLLIHRTDDAYADSKGSRDLARAIEGARLVELPGREHPIWMGDVDQVAALVEEFLTGMRPVADSDRVLAILLVARLAELPGRPVSRPGAAHPGERSALFHEAVPKVMERYSGHAEWLGADRIAARFDGPARAVGAAVALREAAVALGLAIAQGIHVGEIDLSLSPLAGAPVDIAERIAASARAPDILLSRLASDLVSGAGMQFIDRGPLAGEEGHDPLRVVALATERHLEPVGRKPRAPDPGILTPREREVLALVAEGSSNTHIALQLGLSEHTVKRHVANILLKLDLPTRTAAAGLVARQPAP